MGGTEDRRPDLAGGLEQLLVSGLQRVLRGSVTEVPVEGLRERKKQLMRRQISDTATAMFLERGFDAVRVSEIAERCGVSEKTVFNYFPTKESLVLDREDDVADDLRRALGPDSGRGSPVEAFTSLLAEMAAEVSSFFVPGARERSGVERFMELIENTPSLRAAQLEMSERLAQVAAVAMAARAGVNPDDPEPQVAAHALVALWRIYWRAVRRHASSARSPAELRDAVSADVRRAARLIDTGLWAFGLVVQGANRRQQFLAAADAADEARKQVVSAIRQARQAWLALKGEARPSPGGGGTTGYEREQLRAAQRAARQAHREVQEAGRELRRAVRDVTRQDREAAREVRRRPGRDSSS